MKSIKKFYRHLIIFSLIFLLLSYAIIYFFEHQEKNYLQIPIELKLKAGYHEFALFVNEVENFPQFMRVDDVKITGDIRKGKKHDISLTVSAFALEGN